MIHTLSNTTNLLKLHFSNKLIKLQTNGHSVNSLEFQTFIRRQLKELCPLIAEVLEESSFFIERCPQMTNYKHKKVMYSLLIDWVVMQRLVLAENGA